MRIILEEQVVTADRIKISSSSTIWCDKTRVSSIDIKDLLTSYAKVVKTAKALGCKITYSNHYKKTILDYSEAYQEDIKTYNSTFDALVNKWASKLAKGLYSPTCDDIELRATTELDFILQRMNYRSCSISILNDISYKLAELLHELTEPNEFKLERIYL